MVCAFFPNEYYISINILKIQTHWGQSVLHNVFQPSLRTALRLPQKKEKRKGTGEGKGREEGERKEKGARERAVCICKMQKS